MEYEMEAVASGGGEPPMDPSWQVDSEWVDLTSATPQTFQFVPSNSQGGRFLLVEHQTLRLISKSQSGHSYWVCCMPSCRARCLLDPQEKTILRYSGDHNHSSDMSRNEYKKFIQGLKAAVKENPQAKPKDIYEAEVERVKALRRSAGLSEDVKLAVPNFEEVRTAMYNTRNAALSVDQDSSPSKRTRERSSPRKKSMPSKTSVSDSPADLEELEPEEEISKPNCAAPQSLIEQYDETPHPTSEQCEAARSPSTRFYFLQSSRGSQLLVIEDFLLYQNAQRPSGKSYWKCPHHSCSFRAVFDSKANAVVKTTGLHNHLPDHDTTMKKHFIQNVKALISQQPHVPAKSMYDAEVERFTKECDDLGLSCKIPPYNCVKHYVYRIRKSITSVTSVEDEEEEEDEDTEKCITKKEREFLEDQVQPQGEESSATLTSLLTATPMRSQRFPSLNFYFVPSKYGKRILVVNEYTLRLNVQKSGGRYYWKCTVDPCLYRCVYNDHIGDLVKVNGKHSHVSNVNQLRTREFKYLLKSRLTADPNLTPKVAYDQEIARLLTLENGESVVQTLPAYPSLKNALYKCKQRASEDSAIPANSGAISVTSSNDFCLTDRTNKEQDISPKDLTHLSLEDRESADDESKELCSVNSGESVLGLSHGKCGGSNVMEIATPSLYDNHDIIDSYCNNNNNNSSSINSSSNKIKDNEIAPTPDLGNFLVSFAPTKRGGKALVVNGCVLRISYTRQSVSYWRCQRQSCSFRCSYDSGQSRLLRVSGDHNHPINAFGADTRSFVRMLKERVSANSDLSPKITYDTVLAELIQEGKDSEFISRLPSYESLKSTLYKVKLVSKSACSAKTELEGWQDESSSLDSEVEDGASGEDASSLRSTKCPPPPEDSGIDAIYSPLMERLQEKTDKYILDGYSLSRHTDTSSSAWVCDKTGCPFRCVIDHATRHVTRGKLEHTHRGDVIYLVTQTFYEVVKLRALLDSNLSPLIIYRQERKRMTQALNSYQDLLRFMPSLSAVYQRIQKTRANPPRSQPGRKLIRSQLGRQDRRRRKRFAVDEDVPDQTGSSTASTGSSGRSEGDLVTGEEEDADRLNVFIEDNHQLMGASVGQTLINTAASGPALINTASTNQVLINTAPTGQDVMGATPMGSALMNNALNSQGLMGAAPSGQDLINTTSTGQPSMHTAFSDHSLLNVTMTSSRETLGRHFPQSYSNNPGYNTQSSYHHDVDSTSYTSLLQSEPNSNPMGLNNTLTIANNRTNNWDINSDHLTANNTRYNQSLLFENSAVSSPHHHHHHHQVQPRQQAPPPGHCVTMATIPTQQQPDAESSGLTLSQTHSGLSSHCTEKETVFSLQGYPLIPVSSQIGNQYWQCRVPGCQYQCVLNGTTGQVVQISGNHNHEPPSSHSALSSQMVKILQRKSAENLSKPLSQVYREYVRTVQDTLGCDLVVTSVPRFEDVYPSMQAARNAMARTPPTNLSGPASVTPAVPDFTFDPHKNSLVVGGEHVLFCWRKNELSVWACSTMDCRLKCVLDESLPSLHILQDHSTHCPLHSPGHRMHKMHDSFDQNSSLGQNSVLNQSSPLDEPTIKRKGQTSPPLHRATKYPRFEGPIPP